MSQLVIPPPQVDFLDQRNLKINPYTGEITGTKVSREWLIYLNQSFTRLGGTSAPTINELHSIASSSDGHDFTVSEIFKDIEDIQNLDSPDYSSIVLEIWKSISDINHENDLNVNSEISELKKQIEDLKSIIFCLGNSSAALSETDKTVSKKAPLINPTFTNSTTDTLIATAAAPTVAAAQVGYGSTVSATIGIAGAAAPLPLTPQGYLVINVAGSAMKIPYYLP